MKKGIIGYNQITQSTDNFSIEGMVSPSFINNGDTTVRILFEEIPPKGQFALDFPGLILEGTIPVTFLPAEPGAINLVNVYYGTVKKDCN